MGRIFILPLVLAIFSTFGCERTDSNSSARTQATPATESTSIPASFFTTVRPADVPFLNEVKTDARPGDEVVFLARIGGRIEPFVQDLAMFITADPSLQSCEIKSEEDYCPVPQDYCCEDQDRLRQGLATIQLTSLEGAIIPVSAKGAGGLESLKFVVVSGEVKDRNDDGLFIVDASKIWVGGKPTWDDRMRGSMNP